MPALTSVLNKAVPDEGSIQLFYNTSDLNMGIMLMDGRAAAGPTYDGFKAQVTSHTGLVVNPSSMDAGSIKGTTIVVGITTAAGDDKNNPNNDVAIISPIYAPLTSTSKKNTGIAFSSSGDSGWVSFIQGADAQSLKLSEYSIDGVNLQTFDSAPRLLTGTELASYYNVVEGKRYILFQSADNSLFEICADNGNFLHLDNVSATAQTPLAVTLVGKNSFLYFLSPQRNVQRVIKTDGVWGEGKNLGWAPCAVGSDLAVTTANSINHVFYLPKDAGANKFAHKTDSLIAPAPPKPAT